jgi:hypothetical protein
VLLFRWGDGYCLLRESARGFGRSVDGKKMKLIPA